MTAQNVTTTVQVWDRFVRVFHWALVSAVTVAAITGFVIGAPALDLHIWAGAAIAALVLARLIWGFLGSYTARFSSFVVGPRATLAHLRDLRAGRAHRHLGHNPLGGAMILALLGCVTGVLVTGVVFLGGVFHTGPLAALVTFTQARSIAPLHQALAIGLLLLVAAHVGGALFESLRTRENLVKAMVTGRKLGDDAAGPQALLAGPRPVVAVLLVASCCLLTGGAAVSLSHRPFQGMPVPVAGSLYASQCSDCHAAFHPSLLPAASWTGLMQSLDTHFGEDATLPAGDVAQITAFLTANAADSTDTKPAHVFRTVDPAKPFQITATPFWLRTHARLGAAVFAAKAVGSKANCGACHADAAAGWFYPGQVEVPEEAQGKLP